MPEGFCLQLQDSRSDTEDEEDGYESDIENKDDNDKIINGQTNGSVVTDKIQTNGKSHVGENGF